MSTGRLRVIILALAATVTVGHASQQAPRPWPPGVQPPKDSSPLSPQDEMQTFYMPPGYHVELVASEPLIQDAIFMDFDPDGRLWVIEMPAYMPEINPSNEREREPTGRIVVLEDTHHDGKMDKRTVFMDRLILPRALKVLDHGVLVGEPPNLWLVHDDGTLHAGAKELVTDTYGRRDSTIEHNANSLTWALDNWIYTSEVDMYLRLKNGKFEVRKTLSRGQWGNSQDDAGRIYRNSNQSVLAVDLVPTPYFARNPNLLRQRGSYESLEGSRNEVNKLWPVRPTPGVNRGYQEGILRPDGSLIEYTSVNSPTVYRGDRLPAELYGNVFVAEPAGNTVSRIIISDDGKTLQARKAYDGAEFLTSTDERFRPVYMSSAPDGTLYVLDMYRGIIQHKASITEYLKDQILSRNLTLPTGLSRVYRVVHDTARRADAPALSRASSAQLVAMLSHPNGWWRDTAQRLLVERADPSVVPALTRLAESAPDARTRVHALWTLDGIDRLERATVITALQDSSRDVRASAVRLAERWLVQPDPQVHAAVLKRLDDADWSVQEQLAASLGELPAGPRETAIVSLIEKHGDDPVVMDAALSGVRGREVPALTTVLEANVQTPQREAAITMLAGMVMRGAQDAAAQTVFQRAAETTRPKWQRAALLHGAEVALLGAAMPGTPRGPAPGTVTNTICATCPPVRGGPGGASAFGGGGRGRAAAPANGDPTVAAPPASVTTRAAGPGAAGAGAGIAAGGARGGRGRGGGGVLLRLVREPASLTGMAAGSDDLAQRAASLLARVEWPGKPGASAPVIPLTAVEQQRFLAGQEVFLTICAACHQEDGRGKERVAPSLVGSTLATGPAEITARILFNGKEGPIGLMPPLGQTFTDDQVAAVLTYVRRQWGNSATPVDSSTVHDVRAATAGRTRPWTNEELAALAAGGRGGQR